ncbi:MAG: hypothetical protein ACYDHW_04785 [Syntrophorhabdaceae bacterium]
MKSMVWIIVILGIFIVFAGTANAADPSSASSTSNLQLDEPTKQFFKKHRSLDSELIEAHRDLYRYNNPEYGQKNLNLEDLINQEGLARRAREEQETVEMKKKKTEEKIKVLQKSINDLQQELVKYYNGKVPQYVSDSWKTEDDYTAYVISKIK